jgi:hypothetical protein
MFDNTETDSLELLRFYPSLTAIDGFEEALHDRVRQVGRLPDHAFPLIVAVERLEGDGALALVSTHTPGKRLSAFFDKPGPRKGLNPSFVTGVVTQVVQALTVLQSKGDDITHSALTPDRVVITTGGRVCVVEHVLGSALRQLDLSVSQLWREFGLVSAPDPTGELRLDARTDVFQLGILALEMLIGRRLTPLDLKDRLPDLLEHWSDAATRVGLSVDRMQQWLERALQIGDDGYKNAADALSDLRDMPSESAASAFDALPMGDEAHVRRSLQPAKQATGQDPLMANASAHDDLPLNTAPTIRPALISTEARWAESFAADAKPAATPGPRLLATAAAEPAQSPAAMAAPAAPPAVAAPAPAPKSTSADALPKSTSPAAPPKPMAPPARLTAFKAPRVSPWIAAALAAVALAEGVVIVALLMRTPTTSPSAATTAPPPAAVQTQAAAPPVASPPTVADDKVPAAEAARIDSGDAIRRAAGNQRSGGVRLVTPIELKVLEGDRVLGSTADGPIIATAGTHQLELLNAGLGVRIRQAVTFRPGEIGAVNVAIPQGRASFNAQPWGEVLIDGRSVGETPLANVSVPLGEHEVVFRHPELGERRQTITVKADQPARVSTSFTR